MAKYKLQEMSDMRDEGKRRVYPKMVPYRTLSRKEFVEQMQSYHRNLSQGTIEAVLTDVEDVLVRMLSMGYNVNLEGLGTFSLSLGFEDDKPTEMQTDDDMMKYRKVGVKNVNFNSSPEFVKAVKMETDCDLERVMSGVKVIRKQLYSKEERIARALSVLEKNAAITLGDYAYINYTHRRFPRIEGDNPRPDITYPLDWKRKPQGLGEEERIN